MLHFSDFWSVTLVFVIHLFVNEFYFSCYLDGTFNLALANVEFNGVFSSDILFTFKTLALSTGFKQKFWRRMETELAG